MMIINVCSYFLFSTYNKKNSNIVIYLDDFFFCQVTKLFAIDKKVHVNVFLIMDIWNLLLANSS